MVNPFQYGGVVSQEAFCNRRQEIDDLLRAMENGERIFVYSERRMGKTSLLRVLAETSPPGVISIFINMQRAIGLDGKLDPKRFSRVLLHTARRQYSEWLEMDKVETAKELVEQIEALAWAAEDAGLTIQFLWDEAELLADLPQATLISLRAVLQGNPGALRTVLAASMGLAGLNDHAREWQSSPFLFGFATRYICPLDESEALALIEQRDHPEGPVAVPPEAIPALIKACDGHPYLLQALCLRLYELEKRRLRFPTHDVLAQVRNEEALDAVFQQDYDNLSYSQREVLHLLAKGKMNVDELVLKLAPTEEQARPFLNSLTQLGLIRQENGSYRLACDLLGEWLRGGPIRRETRLSDKASVQVDDQARTGDASPVMLAQLLTRRLDEEELRVLCFDVSIDYDSLRGEGRPARTRELVAHLNRRDELYRLVKWLKARRQDIKLEDEKLS